MSFLLLLPFILTLQPHRFLVLLHQIVQDSLYLTCLLQLLSFIFLKSFIPLPLLLFICRPSVLIPITSQSVILLTSFISSILLRCHHHFILSACTYLTISSPFITFSSSLLFLILHPSLHQILPNIFLNKCLSKQTKLYSRT